MATKTARTKRAQVQAKPILNNTDELDDALRQLCDIKSNIDIRTAEMNQELTRIKEECDDDLSEDLALKARLEKDVEEYCTYYRNDIFPVGKKSLELVHGEVNFRQHPPTLMVSKRKRMTWATVLDRVREVFGKKYTDYVRVKEEPIKDALITLDETQLDDLGLEISRKETFGFNLKIEELAPASSTTT